MSNYRPAPIQIALAPLALAALQALAQAPGQNPPPQTPDAGQLQRQALPAPAAPAAARERIPGQSVGEPLSADPSLLKVSRVSISGNTVLASAVLLQAFTSGLEQAGGPPSLPGQARLGQLQAGAARVAALYAERGYFLARVVLPSGGLSADGALSLRVLEGQLSRLDVQAPAATDANHQVAALAQDTLAAHGVQTGQPITQAGLEQALMVLAERGLPDITAAFSAGDAVGSTAMALRGTGLATGPRFALGADNHGGRFTGAARAHLDYGQQHLLQVGDNLSARYSASQGGRHASNQAGHTHTLSGSYSLPVGLLGTKLQLNAAALRYEVGGPFAALSASGSGSSWGLLARHPLQLQTNSEWVAEAGLTQRRSSDDTFAGNTASKRSTALQLGINHTRRSALGSTRLVAGVTQGRLSLDGNPAFAAADATTAATAGAFHKLRLDAVHQYDTPNWQWLVRASAQASNRNLDSAEKFALGGASGVRAFASGEGSGDSGQLLSLELRGARLQWAGLQALPSFFYDYGSVQQHNTPWTQALAPGQANRISLGGAGLGLQLVPLAAANASAQLTLAWPTTGNPLASPGPGAAPGAPALGSDGRAHGIRAWLSVRWAL